MMNSKGMKSVIRIVIAIALAAGPAGIYAQMQQGVLEPENANQTDRSSIKGRWLQTGTDRSPSQG